MFLTLSVSDLLTFFITRMFFKAKKKKKPDSHFGFFPTYKFTRDSVFTAAEKLLWRRLVVEFIKTIKTNVMVNDIDTNQVHLYDSRRPLH